MKFAIYGLIGILSFAGSIGAGLLITGNLNGEALARLTGAAPEEASQPAAPAPAAAGPDAAGPLVQQLKQREAALDARKAELDAREQQLVQRESDLQKLRTELDGLQQQIGASVEAGEQQRATRLQAIAITLENMKPDKAAERIEGLSVDDAAEILGLMKDKQRGKVIEAMEPNLATRVLRALQERRI